MKWLRLDEAAEFLDTSPLIVLSMVRHGELPVAAGSLENLLIWKDAVEKKAEKAKRSEGKFNSPS
ncbi:MAG: hypothetical protein IIA89_14220 [Chloroflexi bacterium]|nr:hypothetical protein [Chloroflexota bacterium]